MVIALSEVLSRHKILSSLNLVKPGLQAAFVDIGLERAGFLHASDLDHDDTDEDDETGNKGGRGRGRYRMAPL